MAAYAGRMTNETSQHSHRYRLYGSIGSPYALKLRSLMRYKRLAFDWVPATLDWIPDDLPHPPLCEASGNALANLSPRVVPAVFFPEDASIRNESTTIAYLLDSRNSERPSISPDPGVAFLSHLIEDMADEWLVKIAFHYRWGDQTNSAYKSRIVTGEFLGGDYDHSTLAKAAGHFAARQQSRMPLVGCTPENAQLIEASFKRVLAILDRVSDSSTFLFGASPTLADFGIYGQLQSLATDPTPWVVMREHCMGVFPYLQLLEDASGIEPADITVDDLGEAAIDFVRLAASIYLPYLKANELALNEGRSSFTFEVDNLKYSQAPFKYHGKCLRNLRQEHAELPPRAKRDVDKILGDAAAMKSI
jgi:glutathione S-transferase